MYASDKFFIKLKQAYNNTNSKYEGIDINERVK